MPDFPFDLADRDRVRLAGHVDREGKIPRALAELADLPGRRVLLADGDEGLRAEQLRDRGATVSFGAGDEAGPHDAYVSFWGGLHPDAGDAQERLELARSRLGTAGRIVLVHDYGRDDVARLLGDAERERRRIAWSDRKGWFVERGFKLHVVHCWWTFDSLDQAAELLGDAFGGTGSAIAAGLRRPRLAHKVCFYHLRVE